MQRVVILVGLAVLAAGPLRAQSADAGGEGKAFHRAHHLYTLQEYQLAAEALEAFLKEHPKSEHAEQARLLFAESLYQRKDYPRAAEQFETYLDTYPKAERRAQAFQRAVKSGFLGKRYAQAVERAQGFVAAFAKQLEGPETPPALPSLFESVLYYGGESAYARKQHDAARGFWEKLLAKFPQSKLRPDVSEGLGWIAFEKKEYAKSADLFAQTAGTAKHPRAAASQLMHARALAETGKRAEALAALGKLEGVAGADAQAGPAAYWKLRWQIEEGQYEEAVLAAKALLASQLPKNDASDAPQAALIAQGASQAFVATRYNAAQALATQYLAAYAQGADRPAMARVVVRCLAAQGKKDEALAAARTAVQEAAALKGEARAREHPAALMLLAELDPAEAGALYEQVLKEHPDARLAWWARYQLAYRAGQSGKIDAGLVHAQALLKALAAADLTSDAEAQALRGKALFAAGDFAFRLKQHGPAEDYLTRYAAREEVRADPAGMQLPLVQLQRAWCRFEAKDYAAVEELLAPDLKPDLKPDAHYAERLYLRGQARLTGGKLDEAAADFERLVKDAPDTRFAHAANFALGERYFSKQAWPKAVTWLTRLVESPALFAQDPQRVDGQLLRAQAYLAQDQWAAALKDSEAVLRALGVAQHPDTERITRARLLKALCLERMPERAADAEAAYTDLIGELGEPPYAAEVLQGLLQRGRLRFRAKKYEGAAKDLDAYLKSKPEGEQEKAAAEARLQAELLLALCEKELKQTEAAQARLRKLKDGALGGQMAFEVPFQMGNLAYDAQQYAEAAAHYQAALDKAKDLPDLPKPARVEALRYLAWSRKLSAKPDEAAQTFADLIALDPSGIYAAESRYHRGLLLAEAKGDQKKLEQALAVWRELLAKHPDHELAEKTLLAVAALEARAGVFKAAQKSFHEFLTRFPKSPLAREAWVGLGESRLATAGEDAARVAASRDAFMKALGEKGLESELDEVAERALLGMAESDLAKGDAAGCKKLALRVVIERPTSPWMDSALFLCGRASEELREPARAISYYRKLLETRPESPRAESARARLKGLGSPPSQE